MLRAQVVGDDRAAYYVADLGPAGRGPVAGESPGRWSGRGADRLGLRGEVAAADLEAVLAGRDPGADRWLRREAPGRSVGGVDLVWCAPKSVSLLGLLGPAELAREVTAAHHEAVADAAAYLERDAAGVRRSSGGSVRHLPAAGLVAAGFTHRTSRALDPHLHTHLVVANVAQGPDGLWSGLDTRRLFRHVATASALYDARLRHELVRRAGVAWERTAAGRWEVTGIDPVALRLFSQRAASMDEHRWRTRGREEPVRPRSRGRWAEDFHHDRPAKDTELAWSDLVRTWRARAADVGVDLSELARVVGRADALGIADVASPTLGSGSTVGGQREGPEHRRLLAAVAEASPSGCTVRRAEDVAAALRGLGAMPPIDDHVRRRSSPGHEQIRAPVVDRGVDRSVGWGDGLGR